jgi:hypothetical protein
LVVLGDFGEGQGVFVFGFGERDADVFGFGEMDEAVFLG